MAIVTKPPNEGQFTYLCEKPPLTALNLAGIGYSVKWITVAYPSRTSRLGEVHSPRIRGRSRPTVVGPLRGEIPKFCRSARNRASEPNRRLAQRTWTPKRSTGPAAQARASWDPYADQSPDHSRQRPGHSSRRLVEGDRGRSQFLLAQMAAVRQIS
jgi:hypothetical protein